MSAFDDATEDWCAGDYGDDDGPKTCGFVRAHRKETQMGFSTKTEYKVLTIEAGRHTWWITKAVLTESKKKEPMLALQFTCVDDGMEHEEEAPTCRDWVVLKATRYGFGKLAAICEAIDVMGCEDDPVGGLDPFDQGSIHQCLLGKFFIAEVVLEEEEYKGKKRTNIRIVDNGYYRISKSELARLDLAELELGSDAYLGFKGEFLKGGMNGPEKSKSGGAGDSPEWF